MRNRLIQKLHSLQLNIKNPQQFRTYKIKPKLNSYMNTKPNMLRNLKDYLLEYCNVSGIHGIRYLSENGRFIVEKITWTIILIVMSCMCIGFIYKAYTKWVSAPVIVAFSTKETPIWEIPFPAVTICPDEKFDPNIFNLSDVYIRKYKNSHVTPEENEIFEILSLICPGISLDVFGALINISENGSPTVNEGVFKNILDHILLLVDLNVPNTQLHEDFVSPDVMSNTQIIWLGKMLNASEVSNVYTEEGLCYSFNMIDPNKLQVYPEKYSNTSFTNHGKFKTWTLERGYSNENKSDDFPRRTFFSGYNGGLEISLLTNKTHIFPFCSETKGGFSVTIHNPTEFPNVNTGFRLPADQAVMIAIKPKMITYAEELKDYAPEYRMCYFSDERRLAYFSSYSQQKCLDECFTNYTMRHCGCATFYMPRSKSFPICGPGQGDCIENSRTKYLVTDMDDTAEDCNCLPSCTFLEYEVEVSQTDWDWREIIDIFQYLDKEELKEVFVDLNGFRSSRLVVYFKQTQFLALERRALYGTLEFFSSAGGLLGLFIGFSLTSAVEILYFLTLRLICNFKKFGGGLWSS